MSSTTYDAATKDIVSVGRHDADAERRADQHALGAESRLGLGGRPARATSAPDKHAWRPAPAPVANIARTPGTPLAPAEQRRFGRAFDHDFSKVRIHGDDTARSAAESIGARAFTVGDHIALPDPQPGILSHELGHVVEQARGRDSPGMVRRLGVGEWFARLFGEGTYSDDELKIYLSAVSKGKPEDTSQSDDKARQVVGKGLHKTEGLEARKAMILDMMSGFTGDDDEKAILKILEDSPMAEREWLIDHVGGMTALQDEFSGENLTKLQKLLGAVAGQKDAAVPLQWSAKYEMSGAEEYRGRTGVLLQTLGFDPEGPESGFTPVATNEDLILNAGQEKPLGDSPIPHPRRKGGEGFAEIQVGPVDPKNNIVTPAAGQAARQIKTQPPYPAIDTLNKKMIASFTIELATQDVGSKTTSSTRTRSHTDANEAWLENSLGSEQFSKTSVGSEKERSIKRTNEIKKWQRIGKSATAERQQSKAESKNEAITKGNATTSAHTDSKDVTTGGETFGQTNSIEGGAEFKGKFDDKLKGEIKKASKTWITVGKMLLKLGKLLPGTYGKVLRLLGPVGDTILSFFEPDKDDLEIVFDAEGHFELRGTFHAKTSIDGWRKFNSTRKGTSDTKGTTKSEEVMTGSGTTDTITDVSRDTIEEESGAEAGQGVTVGEATKDSVVQEAGQKQIQGTKTGRKKGTTDTTGVADTDSTTNRLIIPVLAPGGVTLTFRAE